VILKKKKKERDRKKERKLCIWIRDLFELRVLAANALYGIIFPMFKEKIEKTTKTHPQHKSYI
jgi:hypothetical protein